jgi:cytochrome P450
MRHMQPQEPQIASAADDEDPHARLALLLRDQRVLRAGRSCTLLRYRDIDAALRNRKLGAAMGTMVRGSRRGDGTREYGPFAEMMMRGLQAKDPPDHTRLRSIVSGAFTPSAVATLADRAAEITDDLLAAIEPGETHDVISGVAARLPLLVIAQMLGIPDVDCESVLAWSRELARGFGAGSREDIEAADRAQESFNAYAAELVRAHRMGERDDLLSALIAAEQDGDRLSDQEVRDFIGGLLFAGHETTKNLIGNGLFLFARHPDQWQLLRGDPTLVPRAVEEVLRYEPPTAGAARVVLQPTEVGGVAVEPGEAVLCLTLAGNRDPDKFTDPQRFDVTRNQGSPLTFGAGVHFCLGAQLARMEAVAAFRGVLSRFGRLELATTNPRWKQGGLRGLHSLPMRFYPA